MEEGAAKRWSKCVPGVPTADSLDPCSGSIDQCPACTGRPALRYVSSHTRDISVTGSNSTYCFTARSVCPHGVPAAVASFPTCPESID